jgi:hypothetical protein
LKRSFNLRLYHKDVPELKTLCKKGNEHLVEKEVKEELAEFAGKYDFSRFATSGLKLMTSYALEELNF